MTSDRVSVRDAMQAMIAGMGVLSAREKVTAAAALVLASNLDAEPDGAKASALSRELRLLVVQLTPGGLQPRRGASEAVADPVQRIQDELARKRREREASG